MTGLNYVTRRGAIYVWRRRLPAWVSRTMYLQISLRTANFSTAKILANLVNTGFTTCISRMKSQRITQAEEMQDRALTELAREIAALLKTSLEALVVHLDETATHAHFTMRAYNDHGEPISNATRLGDLAARQDLAAEVMQRYAPEIERGNKKKVRLEADANYQDTLHRTVKQLHQDLPQEKAALEAEIAAMSQEITEQRASVAKTQKHLAKLETKAVLTDSEIKRKETYSKRLEKKPLEMAEDMARLTFGQHLCCACVFNKQKVERMCRSEMKHVTPHAEDHGLAIRFMLGSDHNAVELGLNTQIHFLQQISLVLKVQIDSARRHARLLGDRSYGHPTDTSLGTKIHLLGLTDDSINRTEWVKFSDRNTLFDHLLKPNFKPVMPFPTSSDPSFAKSIFCTKLTLEQTAADGPFLPKAQNVNHGQSLPLIGNFLSVRILNVRSRVN